MISFHDISQSALAIAVFTLGVVIALELRSIARLRRALEGGLARVFEQLDLLRFENQQLLEGQLQEAVHATRSSSSIQPAEARPSTRMSALQSGDGTSESTATMNTKVLAASDFAGRNLAAGEARLLASLAAARAAREARGELVVVESKPRSADTSSDSKKSSPGAPSATALLSAAAKVSNKSNGGTASRPGAGAPEKAASSAGPSASTARSSTAAAPRVAISRRA